MTRIILAALLMLALTPTFASATPKGKPKAAHVHVNFKTQPYALTDNSGAAATQLKSKVQMIAQLQNHLLKRNGQLTSLVLSSWGKHKTQEMGDIQDHEIAPGRQVWIAKVRYNTNVNIPDMGYYAAGAVSTQVLDAQTGRFLEGEIRGKRLSKGSG